MADPIKAGDVITLLVDQPDAMIDLESANIFVNKGERGVIKNWYRDTEYSRTLYLTHFGNHKLWLYLEEFDKI